MNDMTDIDKLKDCLKTALNEIAKPLEIIPFTRENYNKLFPYSKVETPIENVKLGEHQFEKLEANERQIILKSVYDALSKPDVIIDEKRQSVFGDLNTAHLYAKSFKINDKNKIIQSVVVAIENENVSISTHERDINNLVNKIKKPEQLIFASAEIGQIVERITGKQLVTVNPTRENGHPEPPLENIPSQSESVNEKSEAEILAEPRVISVNGNDRFCNSGVLEGFKNAVKMIDDLLPKARKTDELSEENAALKKQNAELQKKLDEKSRKRGGGIER